MFRYLLIVLLISPIHLFSQEREKFFFTARLTPEIVDPLDQRTSHGQETGPSNTFNIGTQVLLQYNLNSVLFFEGGFGFIPRKINTNNYFNQWAIPPPRQSFTQEGVHVSQVSYRILQMPVMMGINLASGPGGRLFAEAGVIGNFLMNACYDLNAKKYSGTYDKNVWLGHTLQVGGGFDLALSKSVWITFGIDFTFENTVKADPYIHGHGEQEFSVAHTYNNAFFGIKLPIRK